jgi:hypothetical protein
VSLLRLIRNDTYQIGVLEIEMATLRFQTMQPTKFQPQAQPLVQSRVERLVDEAVAYTVSSGRGR